MHNKEQFLASREDCHTKTTKAMDDWETLLQRSFHRNEESQKTAKLFTRVDTLSHTTQLSMAKTSDLVDQLLNEKLTMLATIKDLHEIQSLLDMKALDITKKP